MSSIRTDRASCLGVGQAVRFGAVALTVATLGACAQSAVVTQKPASFVAGRQASPEAYRKASIVTHRQVAAVAKKDAPPAANKPAAEMQNASHGIASFYSE